MAITSSTFTALQRSKLRRTTSHPKRPDPTIHLYIGATTPPVHMSTSQALLTTASRTLRRHLQSQVPNAQDYATREKTMKMRHELPSTVSRFLSYLEHGSYDAGGDDAEMVRSQLRLCVFAEKYEVRGLGRFAKGRAGAALERLVGAVEVEEEEAGSADLREAEGEGGRRAWGRVEGRVLGGVEGGEREVLGEVLGRLVSPFVWKAGGDAW